jgi:small subunit ribosomal protein S20|tara:strand:+ start:201 stop:455 length:255 start_codon:yes stop_codon:yes gene_type:complete
MPTLKSSKKTLRKARLRRVRNKGVMSVMRGAIKQVRLATDVEVARTALSSAISVIDRTVRKGVLHANTGSRYKSRLTLHVQKLG